MGEKEKTVQLLEQLNCKMDKLIKFLDCPYKDSLISVEVSERVNNAFQCFLNPNAVIKDDKSF